MASALRPGRLYVIDFQGWVVSLRLDPCATENAGDGLCILMLPQRLSILTEGVHMYQQNAP